MGRFLIGLLIVAVIALGGAFYYYSEPDIARDVLEAKYAAPPSQFVMLGDGARAHIRDRGPRDAPVLMLIHGSNASLFTWEPWASRLSDSFRVVSIDLPGHGLTGAVPNQDYSQEGMVWFVKEVADKLGLQSFAIAGNSMGGGVAARFAEEYPQRVTHLILVDAGGMAVAGGDKIPLAFQLARIPIVNRVMLYVTPRALVTDGLNKAIVHKEIINDAMIDSYWDFARMEGTRQATLDRFSLDEDDSVRAHIGAITAPTLILWGAEDGLIPVGAAYAYRKAIAGSQLIVYSATGHIPQEEVADRSAADVRAFLTAK